MPFFIFFQSSPKFPSLTDPSPDFSLLADPSLNVATTRTSLPTHCTPRQTAPCSSNWSSTRRTEQIR
ncbi:hypothetical protein IC582_010386 [Cucumis melo]